MIHDLGEAIAQGRASAQRLVIVAMSISPAEYMHLFGKAPMFQDVEIDIVDCCTDAYGWRSNVEGEKDGTTCQTRNSFQVFSKERYANANAALQDIRERIFHSTDKGNVSIVIDSLQPLIDNFGLERVVEEIFHLKNHDSTASMLYRLHADLMKQHEIQMLLQDVAHVIDSTEISWDELLDKRGVRRIHGRLNIFARKRSGCIHQEIHEYFINSDGLINYMDALRPISNIAMEANDTSTKEAPKSPIDSKTEIQMEGIVSQAKSLSVSQPKAEGGMRLELSAEEEQARRQVNLPYEHRGQSSLYSTGDYRDYLPQAAGGWKSNEKRLGHIRYVRDSDSEEPDSDEDPDEDLDI